MAERPILFWIIMPEGGLSSYRWVINSDNLTDRTPRDIDRVLTGPVYLLLFNKYTGIVDKRVGFTNFFYL